MFTLLKTTRALVALLAMNTFTKPVNAAWKLQDDFFATTPADFFEHFSFFTEADPTQGSITYVDSATAQKTNLIGFLPAAHDGTSASTSKFSVFLGIDRTSQTSMRNSVRITSTKKYNPPFMTIIDVAHIPVGPSTWPAFWLLGSDGEWPSSGELDLIEGVNAFQGGNAVPNAMTLHTGPGCSLQGNGSGQAYTGTLATADCDVNDPKQKKNAGCSITAPTGVPSFGPDFNAAGGGTYVAAWETTGFTIWFFPAKSQTPRPKSLDTNTPDPTEFGKPVAAFQGAGCNWAKSFRDMQIIFNTALCGQWAGEASVWQQSGCQKMTGVPTCAQFVQSGKDLDDAYWLVQGLRTFAQ